MGPQHPLLVRVLLEYRRLGRLTDSGRGTEDMPSGGPVGAVAHVDEPLSFPSKTAAAVAI
ncbi:hypothetical protein GCM10023178_16910 [Actinomadura luteofluorescens]